ncbi:MAG TPA: hypothetical protein VOA88_10685 [Candidatus Dormibacteraeota bacterium]|jgi:hypothetical protein|nr:hypothetical protein [Candidatus Dormibacteraeota bacterium]
MAERVRQIVKLGEWLYDATVPCEVRIIKTNFFEHPISDASDEKLEGYPPRDAAGNFYFVEYTMSGYVRGVSNCFGSVDEAVQEAATKLQGLIRWM